MFIIVHATIAYLFRACGLGGALAFALAFVRLRPRDWRSLQSAYHICECVVVVVMVLSWNREQGLFPTIVMRLRAKAT
jgi:hypothetical protein